MPTECACLSPEMLAKLCVLAVGKSEIYLTPETDGHSGRGCYVWFEDVSTAAGSFFLGKMNRTKTESVVRGVVRSYLKPVSD